LRGKPHPPQLVQKPIPFSPPRLYLDLTPFVPLSLKGEGEEKERGLLKSLSLYEMDLRLPL
jgi:hypothetical protein